MPIMGSAPSAVVVHSSNLQEDREALMAIFPNKFQVEKQSNSNALLLVEGQLTIILISCTQAKGTYATLLLEEAVIQHASERAVIYGLSMAEDSLLETTTFKLTLPGGASLVATTPDVWNNSTARRTAIAYILPSSSAQNGDKKSGITDRHVSPMIGRQTLKPAAVMTRSSSLPDIPPSTISTPYTPTNRLFPSLRIQVLNPQGRFTNFPLNSTIQVPVETDLFVGTLLLIMRPLNPEDDPFWNDKIFSKKKRRVVMKLQGKLKYKPKNTLYAGMEVSDPMNLGLIASGLCNVLLKLSQKFNQEIHYSFGDAKERPHICFPASTFFERLVVTPPGETPPKMGEEFEEPADSVKQRKAYKTKIDWNPDDTYSMSFHSMYLDFPTWAVVALPIGKDMSLTTFWGNSIASVVFYESDDSNRQHFSSVNKYILAVQMKYLGKDAEEAITIGDGSSDGGWSEEQFIELESASISTSGEGGLVPSLDEDSEEELEFFDTVESQSALASSLEMSTTTSHAAVLRLIDEFCPCVIDMFAKRGKYVSVYAFRGRQPGNRPLFRSEDLSVKFLGDQQRTEDDDMFSPRLSSRESLRRKIGLRYVEAHSGKASASRMAQFQKVKTPFDTEFLRRADIEKRVPCIKSGFLARALSDRHWVEEWGCITDQDILFYHADKGKPNFRISLSSVVKAEKVPDSERPLLPSYHFLSIETFGRKTYLMFHSEEARNVWESCIKERRLTHGVQGSATSFTNHLIDVDEPMEEFLQKSTMWDCNKRRILNCRQLSFRTPSTENARSALVLAEEALIKATALQPKGPNDSDLTEFLDCAAALKEADAHTLNEDERLAFFINVYHVMIMHAFIVLGPPDSSFKWVTYFNSIAYQCSDDIFSLPELEHNIIRAEMSFPSQFLSRFILPKSQYRFALTRPDFRINFALNCGSLCMPSGAVPLYKPDSIHERLDSVTRSFANWTISVKQKGSRDISISLPRVCQWFACDFGDGSASDVMKVVEPYLSKEKRNILNGMWNERKQCYDLGIWNVKYLPYNFECRFLTLDD